MQFLVKSFEIKFLWTAVQFVQILLLDKFLMIGKLVGKFEHIVVINSIIFNPSKSVKLYALKCKER